jgi:hypothetical protein
MIPNYGPATTTPVKFQRESIQLCACNIDEPTSNDKPHSRMNVSGNRVYNELKDSLQKYETKDLIFLEFAICVRDCESAMDKLIVELGFLKEHQASSLYSRNIQ